MDPLVQWVLTTLLPLFVVGLVAWIAVKIKVAELNKDVQYLREKMNEAIETLARKAEKEAVDEIKADIKDIKTMFITYILKQEETLKKS